MRHGFSLQCLLGQSEVLFLDIFLPVVDWAISCHMFSVDVDLNYTKTICLLLILLGLEVVRIFDW